MTQKLTPEQQKNFNEGMAIVNRKREAARLAKAEKQTHRKREMDRHFARCASGGIAPPLKNGLHVFHVFTTLYA